MTGRGRSGERAVAADRVGGVADTLFTRYGGFATISRIVSDFYERVLDSDNLAPYFKGVDMAKQIDHQTKFVAFLMGGPASFSDEHLERVHDHLNIDDSSFEELLLVFRETLEDAGMDDTDTGVVVGELVKRKRLVVKGQPT